MRIPPLAIMAFCLVLSWSAHKLIPILYFDLGYLLPAISGLLGVAFLYMSILDFRKFKTTVNPLQPSKATSLVTTGVYSISRNPMYVGMTLLLLSYAFLLGTLSAFLAPFVFVGVITKFQIGPEEQALMRIFNEEWQQYQKKTRRWI